MEIESIGFLGQENDLNLINTDEGTAVKADEINCEKETCLSKLPNFDNKNLNNDDLHLNRSDKESSKLVTEPNILSTETTTSSNVNDDSDSESERINLQKKSRKFAIIDSDSEEEEAITNSSNLRQQTVCIGQGNVDCQSPASDNNEDKSNNSSNVALLTKSKRFAIIDSDSEDDLEREVRNEQEHTNNKTDEVDGTISEPVFVFDKKGQLKPESSSKTINNWTAQKSTLSGLFDSESSEDEGVSQETEIYNKSSLNIVAKKRQPKPPKEPKEKKMTAKQAIQQRQEIHSESQRMLRESRVSLPYHKPKSYSIKEFLQKRSKFASTLIQPNITARPSLAMKMTKQELQIVSERLQEREKEMKKFYESDHESEEEPDRNTPIPETDSQEKNKCPEDIEFLDEKSSESIQQEEKIGDEVAFKILEEASKKDGQQDQEENCAEFTSSMGSANNLQDQENCGNITLSVNNTDNFNQTEEETVDLIKDHLNLHNDPEFIFDKTVQNDISNEQEDLIDIDLGEESLSINNSDESITHLNTTNDIDFPKTNLTTDNLNKISEQVDKIVASSTCELPRTEPVISSEKQNEYSVEYDFNLDDMTEEDPNEMEVDKVRDIQRDYLNRLLTKYNKEDEREISPERPSIRELLKQQLEDIVPSFKLDPGQDVIELDFDDDLSKKSGVAQLMERFAKHTSIKQNVPKNKLELSVVNLSQGEVRTETVSVSTEVEDEFMTVLEKPGIRLKKLKNELQEQIAQRRSELWQQKKALECEDNYGDEKGDYEDEAILDNDEEELTEGETTEEENEIEDNNEQNEDLDMEDIEKNEEIESTNGLLDNEAEESNDSKKDTVSEVDDENNDKEEQEVLDHKNKSKRLLMANPEDSDDSEDENSTKNSRTEASYLSTTDTVEDDDIIPPNLPRVGSPYKSPSSKSTSQFSFLSPIQQISGLQGLNSGSKYLLDSFFSQSSITNDPSSTQDSDWNLNSQNLKLTDSQAIAQSQSNVNEISQTDENNRFLGSDEGFKTQDILSICSGSFSSFVTQVEVNTGDAQNLSSQIDDTPEKSLDESQTYTDINCENQVDLPKRNENNPITQVTLSLSKEVKNLDDDDLISQILNEEELEQFKKKFESPVKTEEEEASTGRRILIDSDDEEELAKLDARKKTQKKLNFSDDESDEEEHDNNEEAIDLHDDDSDLEEDSSKRVIDYDSEENEIEVEYDEEENEVAVSTAKPITKTREFFENEAELSESEWGSDDEDEKGLDTLEVEQGDADVFDENQLKNDLERIHMRRVLDQDNQEVRILQEMLLEDGELHGTGRQRQFRWRNINDSNDQDNRNIDEVDAYLENEESEEQWRKTRHEREMFLKTQSKVDDDDDDLIKSDSQIFKLGQEAIRKSNSFTTDKLTIPVPTKPEPLKQPFSILHTRGSFLARNDKFLTRLAEITKVNTSTTPGVPNNSKKFVFETINDDEKSVNNLNNKKRKALDKTPSVVKKLRLSSNLSPADKSDKTSKKQLFS